MRSGKGKNLLPNGNAFIGSYNNALFVEGKLYELKQDFL
jgi:hypothetical protein